MHNLPRYSTAEAWAPLARKLLDDYGDDLSDDAV
jgi:hypothetical protein